MYAIRISIMYTQCRESYFIYATSYSYKLLYYKSNTLQSQVTFIEK